jgi:nitrogen-specific signal transduction histidine kinase
MFSCVYISMKTYDKNKNLKHTENSLMDNVWEKSLTYVKTVVDVVKEPVLILNGSLRVMTANDSFYKTFQVEHKNTENKAISSLGNGQWNILSLKKLLGDILPKNTFFKGFEVIHDFPFIGRKVMMLNARQVYFKEDVMSKNFPPIILLAIEDVTEIMAVADSFANHTKNMETKLKKQAQKIEKQIKELKKINSL